MLGRASSTRSSSCSNTTRHSRSPKRIKTEALSDDRRLRLELAERSQQLTSTDGVSHCIFAEQEDWRQEELSQQESALETQQRLEQILERALRCEQELREELRCEKNVNAELKTEADTFRSTLSSRSQLRGEKAELGSEPRSRDSQPEDHEELAGSSREAFVRLRNTEEQQAKERKRAEERLQQAEQRHKNERAVLQRAHDRECTDGARHARVIALQEAMQLASSLRAQECEGELLSEQLAEAQAEAEISQQILQESRLERQAYEEESQQRMQMYVAMEQRELRNELRSESQQLETQQELHEQIDQDCQNKSEEVMQLLDECHGFKLNGRTEQATLRRLEKDNERLARLGRDATEQEAFQELQQELEEMAQREREAEERSQECSQKLEDMSQEHVQERKELSEQQLRMREEEASLRDSLAAQRSELEATNSQRTEEAAEVSKIKERMQAERNKTAAHKAEMKKAERGLGIYKIHNEALTASLDKEREARDRAQRKCMLLDEELSQKNAEFMRARAESAEQRTQIATLKDKLRTLELTETLPAAQQHGA